MTATQDHAVSLPKRQLQGPMEFHNPPVVETAIGFYFQKIEGWNVLHHGALWERFRPHYPNSEFLPTIVDNPQRPTISLDFSSVPIRVAFVDKTKTKLVQTQNGLLLHNWRKTPDVSAYQHYETTTRDQLRQDWNTFKAFLRDMSLTEPVVTRCQMDYFNHLVRGEEWQDFAELPKTFTVWKGLDQSVVAGEPQMVSFSVSYRLGNGTVNVAVQPAIRTTDGKEMIQFTLSSSVAPTGCEDEQLFASLDECHTNAALAFLDFTTAEAREKWGQKK
jgi:uncharacterized protein (TIGR04255 family)